MIKYPNLLDSKNFLSNLLKKILRIALLFNYIPLVIIVISLNLIEKNTNWENFLIF